MVVEIELNWIKFNASTGTYSPPIFLSNFEINKRILLKCGDTV